MKFKYSPFELSHDAANALFRGVLRIALDAGKAEELKDEFEKFDIKAEITE